MHTKETQCTQSTIIQNTIVTFVVHRVLRDKKKHNAHKRNTMFTKNNYLKYHSDLRGSSCTS
jgi:hypothetical protein